MDGSNLLRHRVHELLDLLPPPAFELATRFAGAGAIAVAVSGSLILAKFVGQSAGQLGSRE